jgi:RNA 2',3'-cyclic 3'-phosphodiesterase
MARLFFALWPDKPARTALASRAAEMARRCGGRPVPEANLHMTLVFLGEVDTSRIESLRRAADGAACCGFSLALDRIGEFRRARVAWAGCDRPPAELLRFQSALEGLIRAAGFSPDSRPFAPHLTLVRRAREPVDSGSFEPVSWTATSFALVETARGEGAYRTLAEWPLEGKNTKAAPNGAMPS